MTSKATISASYPSSSTSGTSSAFDNSSDGILTSIRRGHIKHIEYAISQQKYIPEDYFNIHVASECGELKILELMISKLPFLDINAVNSDGMTCLTMACWRNRVNIVRYLCSIDKLDLNKKVTQAENTALHIAASYNFMDIVMILLRAGAEKTIENYYGRNPENEALNRGLTEMAELISRFENNLAMKLKLKRQILDQESYSNYLIWDISIKYSDYYD